MAATIGIDVGGTFTDFFAIDGDGAIRTWKRLSTPAAPERAVLDGLAGAEPATVVHGSTVATNALLERKGPRTVLVVTRGFRDILTIRRQVRPSIYALEPRRSPHVVAAADVIEVSERLGPDGNVVVPLEPGEVRRVVDLARASGARAFAVCLLYGYAFPAHERAVAEALRDAGFEVSASHEVLPEHREYERASTTAVNAFLRPPVRGYLDRLAAEAPGLRVIQSSGALAPAAQAAALPVTMVTSGPAGGVLGALAVARAAGIADVITFDMGGTSTDVSLCPGGEPVYRTAADIDGVAVHTPMIDIVTVGAGGGSLARLDAGGALRVGPESAGADPGPACYGRGMLPTVSDANAVLGRLRPEQLLAGTMPLDLARARAALAPLGDPDEIAAAVLAVVNANMAGALRRVSLERGFDPADFTLVAFGGAGPLHACDLADEVGIPRVLVPRHPGVLSALGMVTAPLAIERSAPIGTLDRMDSRIAALRSAVLDAAVEGGWPPGVRGRAVESWFADVRYRGQGHELRVALAGASQAPAEVAERFHDAYARRFGYEDRARPVEVVNLRLRLTAGPTATIPSAPPGSPSATDVPRGDPVEIDGRPATLFVREQLPPGAALAGPAVVIQPDAATFVPAGWAATVDASANLVIERVL